MKKVLMIVYSFPPLSNPGAERAVSFVRLLNNYGWEPLVLTRETGTDASRDLDASVPQGVDIVRTISREPDHLPGFIRAVAGFLVSLLIPDKERLWELFSVGKATRMAKYEGIDLVYTLSPPSSAHLIGMHLKKKHPGVPWVADLCAAHSANQGNSAKSAHPVVFSASVKERYDKKLLGRIADYADCIITGDEEILKNFLVCQSETNRGKIASLVSDGHVQELSEIFEKACRAIAARKLVNSNMQQ
jgi:hypothetical protein